MSAAKLVLVFPRRNLMNCLVCAQEIGFWTKLTHSKQSVCSKCYDEGTGQLRDIVRASGSTATFNFSQASRWTSQFETVRKYRLLGATEVVAFRNSLADHVFKLVEIEDSITHEALTLVASVMERYNIRQEGTPELRDAFLRIGMRERIQLWESGSPPIEQCNGLVLQKGEVCHWEESARLRAMKTTRQFVGRSSSFSIPLGHGFRYRVGSFRGHPIDHTVCEDAGIGVLHITNQRLCFNGMRAIAIPYKKMVSINGFEGGFIVQTSNEKKPGIFVVLGIPMKPIGIPN